MSRLQQKAARLVETALSKAGVTRSVELVWSSGEELQEQIVTYFPELGISVIADPQLDGSDSNGVMAARHPIPKNLKFNPELDEYTLNGEVYNPSFEHFATNWDWKGGDSVQGLKQICRYFGFTCRVIGPASSDFCYRVSTR